MIPPMVCFTHSLQGDPGLLSRLGMWKGVGSRQESSLASRCGEEALATLREGGWLEVDRGILWSVVGVKV